MGFFFILDILATGTLILDISTVAQDAFGQYVVLKDADSDDGGGGGVGASNTLRASRAGRAGSKAGRIIRVLRIIRLVKLWKAAEDARRRRALAQAAATQPGEATGMDFGEDDDEELDHFGESESQVKLIFRRYLRRSNDFFCIVLHQICIKK